MSETTALDAPTGRGSIHRRLPAIPGAAKPGGFMAALDAHIVNSPQLAGSLGEATAP